MDVSMQGTRAVVGLYRVGWMHQGPWLLTCHAHTLGSSCASGKASR